MVIRRLVDPGDVVSAGAPVLVLQERGLLEARVGLARLHADSLVAGSTHTLRIHGTVVDATARAIVPNRALRTRTMDVIFEFPSPGETVPGDLVELSLTHRLEKPGFRVPITALTEGVRGLWSIYTLRKEEENYVVEQRVVDVLATNETHAYIRGSIAAGLQYIPSGVHRVVPGERVTRAGGQ